MVRLLVENGASIFATTVSDEETAAEKCEEDEEGYRGCSEYLYSKYEEDEEGYRGCSEYLYCKYEEDEEGYCGCSEHL